MTESESTERHIGMTLAWSIIPAPTHVRMEATQTTEKNKEALS